MEEDIEDWEDRREDEEEFKRKCENRKLRQSLRKGLNDPETEDEE